jgi:hypothetical protein
VQANPADLLALPHCQIALFFFLLYRRTCVCGVFLKTRRKCPSMLYLCLTPLPPVSTYRMSGVRLWSIPPLFVLSLLFSSFAVFFFFALPWLMVLWTPSQTHSCWAALPSSFIFHLPSSPSLLRSLSHTRVHDAARLCPAAVLEERRKKAAYTIVSV